MTVNGLNDPEVRLADFHDARRRVGDSEQLRRLINRALDEHDDCRADRELPLLTRPGWIPPTPLELGRVELFYTEPGDEAELQLARGERAAPTWVNPCDRRWATIAERTRPP